VDSPAAQDVKTVADEQKAGIRPYFVHVAHDAILGWKTERVGGKLRLTQLRILESIEEPDGHFAVKTVEQVRVLEPGKWSLWRKAKADDNDSWATVKDGTTTIPVIPFVPIYRDFGAATLAEASAQLLFEMKANGSLSHATLLAELKRRGITSPDVDVDDEIKAATAELAAREPQRKENVNI
jgi:hypothetical protein